MEFEAERFAKRAQPFHRGDMTAPHVADRLGRASRPQRSRPGRDARALQRGVDCWQDVFRKAHIHTE